jgi:hypothetical protein
MNIINPRITIRKSGWLGKFFRGEYTVEFNYAVEYETQRTRHCFSKEKLHGARTHEEALNIAQRIKSKITGATIPIYDETVED